MSQQPMHSTNATCIAMQLALNDKKPDRQQLTRYAMYAGFTQGLCSRYSCVIDSPSRQCCWPGLIAAFLACLFMCTHPGLVLSSLKAIVYYVSLPSKSSEMQSVLESSVHCEAAILCVFVF